MAELNAQNYGADPTGATDSTVAFNNCLAALASQGGGTMYVPGGNYNIGSPAGGAQDAVTWTSGETLKILGDGPGSTNFHTTHPDFPYYAFNIMNTQRFIMEDVSVIADAAPSTPQSTYINVRVDNVPWADFHRVAMQGGTARRVNQGIVTTNSATIDIDCCDIRAYVNALYFSTGTANATVRACQLFLNSGSGVSTASNILCDSNMQTIRVMGTTTNSGERGVYWTNGTGGATPAFGFFWDVECNNNTVAGMEFDCGAEIWGNSVWLDTNQGSTGVLHGLVFGSSFQGLVRFAQSTFGGWSGHNVWVQNGNGYGFTDCAFAGNKHAANSYDDIHIASGVDNVTITGCHFDSDAYAGFGGGNHPRSAVYVESGVTYVNITGCIASNGPYGTAALVNNSGSTVVAAGNRNI